MEIWISENWLALYGAVVGTLALILNVGRFIHSVKKDSVKLKLSIKDEPGREQTIRKITDTTGKKDWDIPNLVKLYTLTVRNIGNVDAHIEDAWVICKKGVMHKALISNPNHQMMLSEIPNVHSVELPAKSSKNINVYLRRNEEVFDAKKAVIVDSTGKCWSVSA